MNLFSRGIRYLMRKWKKSLSIFLIVLATSTLILSGLAVLNAQGQEAKELRGTTGTSFSVERNLSTGNWEQSANGSYNNQEFITPQMMKEISRTDGIKGSNGSNLSLPTLYNDSGKALIAKAQTGYVDIDSQSCSYGCTDSKYHKLFLSNAFSLIEGEHINLNDKNKIIISKELAAKENLKIGDNIYAINDMYSNDPEIKLKISGIFSVNADKSDEKNNYSQASYYDYAQYTFMDFSSFSDMVANYPNSNDMDSVEFFVEDPKELETVIQKVKSIESINWNNFNIITNNTIYEMTKDTMDNMSNLIQNMILVTVIISCIVITLVLTMWIRARKSEIGILLAIGTRKIAIVLQFVFEVYAVSACSFLISYPCSQWISKEIGGYLGKEVNSIIVTPKYLMIVASIGFALLLSSVIIASISLLKAKPKEILSKM